MTDTPTPPMTPEQRAEFVAWLRRVRMRPTVADQLEADGVTIATLTAERDAAQDRAYRLAVAIMGGEDAPGLADSLPTETLETLARSNFQRHSEDIDRLTSAQAEIARLTAALATARAALDNIAELNMSGRDENGHRWANSDLIDQEIVWARIAITKGAAT